MPGPGAVAKGLLVAGLIVCSFITVFLIVTGLCGCLIGVLVYPLWNYAVAPACGLGLITLFDAWFVSFLAAVIGLIAIIRSQAKQK